MVKRHKPSREECKIIRGCAERSAGYARVEICPGSRLNINGKYQDIDRCNLNICFVSDQPDWEDTDLFDNAFSWKDFTRGVDLTDDGKGIFDFYVYGPIGERKELQTNVTAYYEDGKLVRVDGTGNGTMFP